MSVLEDLTKLKYTIYLATEEEVASNIADIVTQSISALQASSNLLEALENTLPHLDVMDDVQRHVHENAVTAIRGAYAHGVING